MQRAVAERDCAAESSTSQIVEATYFVIFRIAQTAVKSYNYYPRRVVSSVGRAGDS